MRIGPGGNAQQMQGAGGCPSCQGEASQCCKDGLGCCQNGDKDGLKEILDVLRNLVQQDPQGVMAALKDNPQFVQALQGGGVNTGLG